MKVLNKIKAFFVKHAIALVLTALYLLIFIFGGMYSRYMTDNIAIGSVDSVEYNFELSTFVNSPYLVSVIYGSTDKEVVFYVGRDKQINSVQSGDEPTEDELPLIQEVIDEEGVFPTSRAYFESYNSSNNLLVAVTQGFDGTIRVTIDFSSDLSTIDSYFVVTHETYDNGADYSGSRPPAVEEYYMDEYIDNGTTAIAAVAGASYGTSPAMQDLINLLFLFQDAQTGGGN